MKQKSLIHGTTITKKTVAAVSSLLLMALCTFNCRAGEIESLTYSVYPYLPDTGYYEELIEKRWAEIEPDIKLIRAEWNCYDEAAPEGIDIIIYDSIMRNTLIESGYIQPVEKADIRDSEDIYSFALDGLTVDDKLYGIPVFLCGNYLIYDTDCSILAGADSITDLAGESDLLVISSKDDNDRQQFILEILADTLGEANPSTDSSESDEIMQLIDDLAIEGLMKDHSKDIALAYDNGIGSGYIGYSETMRFLNKRISETDIKSISFSDREDLPRLYVDAVALTSEVEDEKYKKAVELMNVMASADILSELSVKEGAPQYLLLARPSSYDALVGKYPLYSQLEEISANVNNCVILK